MASYDYVTATGTIVPDTSSVLSDVQAEFVAAFGSDLPLSPETPQGVLITGETSSRISVLRNNTNVANQINPNLATGLFLDALWALTGGKRSDGSKTLVPGVVITGAPGLLVPAGVRINSPSSPGDQFESTQSVTIPASGSITVDFVSIENGTLNPAPNTLTQVTQGFGQIGLETVNNPNAATPGTTRQSDASARRERRNTLALQGQGTAEAVMSRVRALPDVRSLAFRENVTNAPVVIDGINLVDHSIWACVDGGTDEDVADQMLEAKGGGSNWNGAITVNVVEPSSGQSYPVKFDRPDEIDILVRVTVRAMGTTFDVENTTKAAVIAYANGEIDGEDGFIVGGDVSPFEIAGAINITSPGIYVTLLEIAYDTGSPTYVTTSLAIALNEVARVKESDIQVIIL